MAVTSIDYTITVANFQTALKNVQDRMADQDWANAHLWLGIAETQNAGLASSQEFDAMRVSRRADLAAVTTALEKAEARVTGPWEIHSRLVP